MTPDDYTNQELMLNVGNSHTIYVHDWGNKDARHPVIFLHGGPGTGCNDKYKQRFDPTIQRVIFHDQRGSGKSTPYGSLEHNTTKELVEDIEKICGKLKLQDVIVTGSSWGSTLALAYALKYPDRIHAMIINGIFTASQQEVDYLYEGVHRTHFPDAWQRFLDKTPANHHDNPAAYHVERLFGTNEKAALESAVAMTELEGSLLSLDDRFTPIADTSEFDIAPTKIEVHYMRNLCFIPDRYLLENAYKINVPTWIVQGRYDFICPPATAYELHQEMPNSQLIWTQAGHGNDRNNYEVMRSLLLQASLS